MNLNQSVNCQANSKLQEVSSHYFKQDFNLVSPKIILGFALWIQEVRGELNEDFFEGEVWHKLVNWASVCEMIHSSSCVNVKSILNKSFSLFFEIYFYTNRS